MRIVDLSKLNREQLEDELQIAQDQMNSWACKHITKLLENIMPDKLTELFNEAQKSNPNVCDFASFQAGFTTSAVSMRTRAMTECRVGVDTNSIKNAIGSLSDIPE